VKGAEYALYVLTVVYFIALCCMYKNIRVSIQVLKTASVIVMGNLRMLVVPFFEAILLLMWSAWWLYSFGYLLSSGEITQPKHGSQLKVVELSDMQRYYAYLHVFTFFWGFELIQALFTFALIVGVCTWYFTSQEDTRGSFSLSTGFWWAFRYNLGSLALGSFILAVVWIIRCLFEYIDKQMEGAKQNNAVARAISYCVRCCLDCFHRFLKFLNENAYCQIALTGENFCASAMAAFVLALKNAATFFITNGIGSLIQFLGRVTISIANTLVGYLIINNVPEFVEDIDSPIPVLAVVFFISFTMATVFMEVYASTSLAIL